MNILTRKIFSSLIFFATAILVMNSYAIAQTVSQTFFSNGTFTVPAGVTSITIETWGGGGAGGGVSTQGSKEGGGGGGGGGYNKVINYAVISGNSYSITVGMGGIAVLGDDGGNGGNSFFGSNICTAFGGKGGFANDGVGGIGGNGLFKGGNGSAGNAGESGGGGSSAGTIASGNDAFGSSGGSTITGGGAGGDGGSSNPSDGGDGTEPGGGGGGARKGKGAGIKTGGQGGNGRVVISYLVANPCTALYWAGENSNIPGGTSGKDFNTAANWSTDPNNYVASYYAPGACNDVIIKLELTADRSGTTITFSNTTTTIKSLNFSVKNISSKLSNGIFEGGLRLGNQSLSITGDIVLYSENNFLNKTTQLTMDCNHDNSLFVYGGNLTTNAVNNGGGSGECIVYPFSNPVGTINKGKFVLKGNAWLQGVGDDANPQLNKPATLVFDGTGTQTITNNNSNGYPIYLAFNTLVGESNTPIVIFTGNNAQGFRSINNFTINNNASAEVDVQQSINRNGSGTPGTFTMKPGALLVLKGNNFPTGYASAYTLDASSTVSYNAANGISQTVNAVSYGNLKLSNASAIGNSNKNLQGNTTVKGNVVTESYVTLNQGSFTLNRSAAGGSFSLASNAIHLLAGPYPANFSTVTINSNSITNYNGASAQNVAGQNYGHLILSNSNTKAAIGDISVAGDLSILNTATFAAGNYSHTIAGNWINNSAFAANNSTITFTGSAPQTIGGTASSQFNNIAINKSNANDVVSNTVKAFSANNLTVTKGNLALSATDNDYTVNGNLAVFAGGTLTHAAPWDPYNKALRVYGNFDVTGIFNPTVRSHVAMSGTGNKLIRTGNDPSSTLSILTFSTGNYAANGKLKTNQEVWAMFGTAGSFSTAGNEVIFNSVLNNNGSINVNGGSLTVLNDAHVGYGGSAGKINITAGNLNIDGNFFNHSSASIVATGTPQIYIKGDWTNDGIFNPGNSTVVFEGAIDEHISGVQPLNFYNLRVNGTNVIQHVNLSILNDLTINTGVFDMQQFTCNRMSLGGTMVLASGCILKLRAGNGGAAGSNFPANFATYNLLDGSTVSYSGSVDQQIFSPPSYSNLRLANAGIKSAGGDLIIRGNLLMENNNVFDGGSFTHKIGGDWINNASGNAFIFNNGRIWFNGTMPQTITGSFGTSFNAVVMDNNSGLTIGTTSPVSIYESLTATGPGKSLVTNDNLTLKSMQSKTAWVGNMAGNTINGKSVVERFVSARKGWRFISIPTNTSQTIKQAWQENAANGSSNPVPGFGTQITSEAGNWLAAGFDQQSYAPSMKYYEPVTDKWIGVSTTNATTINNTKGYMVFIRGDRLSNSINSPATQTNLRTNGNLKIGTQPAINVLPDKFESISNPYACPVDFTKITKGSSISNVFYLWDPYLAGTYNLGGYQTFSAANGWVPVPGGTAAHPSGVSGTIIQNGEAFFVRGKSTGSPADFTLQFTEAAKAGGNPPPFARPMGQGRSDKHQYLRASLLNAMGQLVDGNAVGFDATFSNDVDGDDALKFPNTGENLGLKRSGKSLSVEARNGANSNDTIFYSLSNLSKQNYTLQIVPVNFDAHSMTAFLIDNYKQSTTPVSLDDTAIYSFAVTNEALSFAADRFKIVLSATGVLPVSFISFTAFKKENDILLKWSPGEELNVSHYEIERSGDGIEFEQTGKRNFDPSSGNQYEWIDIRPLAGWNFYRITSVDLDGKTTVSPVRKVNNASVIGAISAYPNPLAGNRLYIRFVNQPEGDYNISIINDIGQQVASGSTSVVGSGHVYSMAWNTNLPHGVYTVKVQGKNSEENLIRIKY